MKKIWSKLFTSFLHVVAINSYWQKHNRNSLWEKGTGLTIDLSILIGPKWVTWFLTFPLKIIVCDFVTYIALHINSWKHLTYSMDLDKAGILVVQVQPTVKDEALERPLASKPTQFPVEIMATFRPLVFLWDSWVDWWISRAECQPQLFQSPPVGPHQGEHIRFWHVTYLKSQFFKKNNLVTTF